MSKLDLNKPVQTRSGLKVTILKTDVRHPQLKLIALVDEGNYEHVVTCTADGKYYISDTPSQFDLVNVPEVTTQYCNLYPEGTPCFHETVGEANTRQIKSSSNLRIALLKITKTDGVITHVELA